MKFPRTLGCIAYAAFAAGQSAMIAEPNLGPADPLQVINRAFPGSVKLKDQERIVEFCPDNTCDGFLAARDVSADKLKAFAYLYLYFFSKYYVLREWRETSEARTMAETLLATSTHGGCPLKNGGRQRARCMLRDQSRNGRIRLIFIRYDEGRRNVVPKDIAKELAEPQPTSTSDKIGSGRRLKIRIPTETPSPSSAGSGPPIC